MDSAKIVVICFAVYIGIGIIHMIVALCLKKRIVVGPLETPEQNHERDALFFCFAVNFIFFWLPVDVFLIIYFCLKTCGLK
jgi:hypothetical protein